MIFSKVDKTVVLKKFSFNQFFLSVRKLNYSNLGIDKNDKILKELIRYVTGSIPGVSKLVAQIFALLHSTKTKSVKLLL